MIIFSFSIDIRTTPPMQLGAVYYYEKDDTFTIIAELNQLKNTGFQIVTIPFLWHDKDNDPQRVLTDVLYTTANDLGLQVYLRELWWSREVLQKYLLVYGSKITYLQVINEADMQLLKKWDVPDELVSKAHDIAIMAKTTNPNIKTVASFALPIIPTLVRDIARHVDIIAMDVYEEIQLNLFPLLTQLLLTEAGKHSIWIGEFGKSTLDDAAQTKFLLNGLDLFQKNGVETTIVWGWKVNEVGLGIKGRQAETDVANWIKQHSTVVS